MKTVTITNDEYNRLLKNQHILVCLEQWGVDNWDGWDDAMTQYHRESEEEVIENDVL